MNNNFAVFILTYGRADNIKTYNILRQQNYTGKIYLICSTDDNQLSKYKKKYEDKVITFNKDNYRGKFDIGDNFINKKVVVYARNAVYDIAENLGLDYFLVLDDDYLIFKYTCDENWNYLTKTKRIKDLDKIFKILLKFYKNTDTKTLAITQGCDYIGGENSSVFKKRLSRKAMNFFICSPKRPIEFLGRINEDATTYIRFTTIGQIFFSIFQLRLEQEDTQSNKGGLTDIYLDEGTYIKSFYSIMFSPSNVKISLMGNKAMRLHHKVDWKYTAPKILDESLKKR